VISSAACLTTWLPCSACGCSAGYGWSGSSASCGSGKTTNPDEAQGCACAAPVSLAPEHGTDWILTGHHDAERPLLCNGLSPTITASCTTLAAVCSHTCDSCTAAQIAAAAQDAQAHSVVLGPTAFFRHTGYYLKQIDPSNQLGLATAHLYVMIINTNLGAANTAQSTAMAADFAWIASVGGRVYVLGHHPNVMQNPALIPAQFRQLVLGTFAGHVHYARSTDAAGFTQISSISQAGETSFTVATISGEGPASAATSYEIDVQVARDVVTWAGPAGTASSECVLLAYE
jgi:hypothetical protein